MPRSGLLVVETDAGGMLVEGNFGKQAEGVNLNMVGGFNADA